jgi:hypothetical protein
MLAANLDPAATSQIAVGDLVQTSQAYRDRHCWPAGRKLGQPCEVPDPWIGVVLKIGARVLCGQRPVDCRCHLERGDGRPEVSDPACPACRGDGSARWRTLDLADLAHAPARADAAGLTRRLPR